MKNPLLIGLITSVALVPSQAAVTDLWITEVDLATRQVEVTHVADETITLETALPFCHRFDYATSIPAETRFGPGESKLFTIANLNQSDSDLWLYQDRNFGNGAKIISGLKWGPDANVGRTGIATTAGKWSGTDHAVSTPALPNETLRLIGPTPFHSQHWSVESSTLGQHPDFLLTFTQFDLTEGAVQLAWEGGLPPYQVQMSSSLPPQWLTHEITSDLAATLVLEGNPERHFFRVLSNDFHSTTTARYTLQFIATWSESTHPDSFPGDPHFSPIVGGAHNEQIQFWAPGTLATEGIESMAETGSTSAFLSEWDNASAAGQASSVTFRGSSFDSPGGEDVEVDVSKQFPLVTAVSMIAPSPDWFVGVHDLSLFDEQTNQWRDQVTVLLKPYDAGTDSGTNYSSGNADTDPPEVITEITGAPLQNGGTVTPLGSFVFTRIQ